MYREKVDLLHVQLSTVSIMTIDKISDLRDTYYEVLSAYCFASTSKLGLLCFLSSSSGALVWDTHDTLSLFFKNCLGGHSFMKILQLRKSRGPGKGCMWTISSAFPHMPHSQDAEFSFFFFF